MKRGLRGWTFSRRSFLAAAAATAAAAAAGALKGSDKGVSAAPLTVLEDPSEAGMLSLRPGQPYTKVWQLKNTGRSPWGPGAELKLLDGGGMTLPERLPLPNAAPGEVVTVKLDLVAPPQPGTYQSQWQVNVADAQPVVLYFPLVLRQATPTPTATPQCIAESLHPYANYTDQTWTLTNPDPNAQGTRVHFRQISLERCYDLVHVLDAQGIGYGSLTGEALDTWSPVVAGRVVQIRLQTDPSVTDWGFCVDGLESGPPSAPVPTATACGSCTCVGRCSCDSVCTCDTIHYWYPN